MKNIFLTLALLLTVSFAFAGNGLNKGTSPLNEKGVFKASIMKSAEVIYNSDNNLLAGNFLDIEKTDNEDYPCRWRICTYKNGVKVGCTAWEYGECLDTVNLGTVKKK